MLRQGDKITIMLEQGKLMLYRNGGNHAIQRVANRYPPAAQQPIHISGPKKSLAGHLEKNRAFQQQPGFCIILIMPDTLKYFRQDNAA